MADKCLLSNRPIPVVFNQEFANPQGFTGRFLGVLGWQLYISIYHIKVGMLQVRENEVSLRK